MGLLLPYDQGQIGFIGGEADPGDQAVTSGSRNFVDPDIGKTIATTHFGGTGFKGKKAAVRIHFSGGLVIYQTANVDEMFLVRGTFFKFGVFPFCYEFMGSDSGHKAFLINFYILFYTRSN